DAAVLDEAAGRAILELDGVAPVLPAVSTRFVSPVGVDRRDPEAAHFLCTAEPDQQQGVMDSIQRAARVLAFGGLCLSACGAEEPELSCRWSLVSFGWVRHLFKKKSEKITIVDRANDMRMIVMRWRGVEADEESALWMLGRQRNPYMQRYTDAILQAQAQNKKNPEGTIVADFVARDSDAGVKRQRSDLVPELTSSAKSRPCNHPKAHTTRATARQTSLST
ncbi:hypothetical protein THAOC_36551, partial [Thalassiosira oceanica]